MSTDKAIAYRRDSGLPTPFAPEVVKHNQAKADAIIDYAKKMRAWSTLEFAVEKKLEDQAEFVRWWTERVRDRGRPEIVSEQIQLSVNDAEALTGITKLQVSKWRRRLKDPENYKAMLFGAAWVKAMAAEDKNIASRWTGDPENYTPAEYIEAARQVMGGIDLDPASNALAQATVKAAEWYDEDENGLLQKWEGRVFLNPPFAYPTVSHFITKLCEEFEAGNVTQAILLTNNNTDTKWWHEAARAAAAICFTAGRINFYKADGVRTQPTNGQNFFYLGADVARFREHFAPIGFVVPLFAERAA